MKKRIIVLVAILAIVFLLSTIEYVIVHKTFENMNFFLGKIEESIKKGEQEVEDIENLIVFWDKKKRVLCTVIPHAEIRQIENYLETLKVATIYKEYFDAAEAVSILMLQCKNLPKVFIFSLENVL